MNSRDSFLKNQDEIQTQQIIKLRLQLISTKRKVDAYQKLNHKILIYQKTIEQIIIQFSKHKQLIAEICQVIELDRSIKQKVIKKKDKQQYQLQKNKKQRDPFEQNIRKMRERLEQLQFQSVLLENIKTSIQDKGQKYKKLSQEYKILSQKQVNTIDLTSFNQTQLKLQHLQKQLKQKDQKLITIQNLNLALSTKFELATKQLNQEKKNAIQISQNTIDRQQQIQKLRYAQMQLADYHGQKQKVKNNCNKLMQILKINQDDYLKCYLRSNGVPLETQRSHRNKYSKVFDS